MGSDFFWFLDIAVVAIAVAIIFRASKRGAVAVLISAVSTIIAFIIAFASCGPITEKIYDSFVRDKVESFMEDRLGSAIDHEMIAGLSKTNMMKTKIDDKYLSELTIEFNERDTAIIDVSAADLTETGIDQADLTGFGIGSDFDWSMVKVGHITVTEQEVKKYGIGNIVLSHIIASNITSNDVFKAFSDIGNKFGDTISPSLKSLGSDLSSGSTDAVYTFIVSLITMAEGTLGERIMDDIVSPMVMLPMKIIVFMIVFSIIGLLLNVIANASKIINKIPIVSSVNGILGAVLGVAEAAITVIIICMVIRFVISVWGNSLVFINETTIERTLIFKHIYAFDPFSLFGK